MSWANLLKTKTSKELNSKTTAIDNTRKFEILKKSMNNQKATIDNKKIIEKNMLGPDFTDNLYDDYEYKVYENNNLKNLNCPDAFYFFYNETKPIKFQEPIEDVIEIEDEY
jgi:hypothetical protein